MVWYLVNSYNNMITLLIRDATGYGKGLCEVLSSSNLLYSHCYIHIVIHFIFDILCLYLLSLVTQAFVCIIPGEEDGIRGRAKYSSA